MSKTAYLHALDEDALAGLIELRRVDTWDGALPEPIVLETCRIYGNDSCAIVPAKGSVAGYAALEAMREPKSFEDGTLIPGLQYLPLAAFHERMYAQVHLKLAEMLAEYDRVIARPFEFGKPRRPIGSIGVWTVEDYGGWFGRGHVCEEFVVWEVVKPQAIEEPQPEDAPDAEGTAAGIYLMRDGTTDDEDDPYVESDEDAEEEEEQTDVADDAT